MEAAETKRCGFKLLAVRESVVKDRDRCCLLIALIVRLEGEIICIKLWSGVRGVVRKDSRMGFVVSQVPKSEGPEAPNHFVLVRPGPPATLLPAECRVLVFKPGECVLKML